MKPILNTRKPILITSLILAVGLGTLGTTPALAQRPDSANHLGVAGAWEGVAEGPAGPFRITLALEPDGDGWRGTFGVPSELVEVPVSGARLRGDSVFVPLAPRRELRGAVAADGIRGVLEIEGHPMPMTLARTGSATAQRMAEEVAAAAADARPAPLVPASELDVPLDVDTAALHELVEAANWTGSHALVVMKDGELVGAWHAGGERRKIELMSATKSVVSLAVGRLLTTGALPSLDEPVHRTYPEWRRGPKSAVTVRHLMNHTSGLASPRPTSPIYESGDFVRFALDAELVADPGAAFAYNNNAVNLLAGVVGEAAGERMDRYLGADLFARLGITDFGWSLDEAGSPHGMSGLQMYAEDLAKLGQLALQRGEWEGERLIDASWFDESFRPGSDLNDGVGLLWWLVREDGEVVGVRADGYLGQYLVVYPDQGLVAVRLVASTPGYNAETDGFRAFASLVRALIRAR